MPEYTYRCTECAHEFDIKHSIMQDALKTCPECTKDTLRKVINSVPGIAFKGTGFYVTDNKKQAAKTPKAKPESKESPKAETDTPKTAEPTATESSAEKSTEPTKAETPKTETPKAKTEAKKQFVLKNFYFTWIYFSSMPDHPILRVKPGIFNGLTFFYHNPFF